MTLTVPAQGQWAGSHHSIDNLTGGWMTYQTLPTNATPWGTQYRAIYVPIRVPRRVVVRKLGYANTSTATGNYDIGLYDAAGTRLVSSGSTAKTTSAATITYDMTDTTIGPGLYYLALNNDTTTDTFIAQLDNVPTPAARGILTETLGSVTLPATATWIVDQTLGFIPIVTALLVTEVD